MRKHKTQYRVVSTFDAKWTREGFFQAVTPLMPAEYKNPAHAGSLLAPYYGAPCAAKDTLLAKLYSKLPRTACRENLHNVLATLQPGTLANNRLRTHSPIAILRNLRGQKQEYAQRKADPLSRPINQRTMKEIKQIKALEGKLLGVEIEFYPVATTSERLESLQAQSPLVNFGSDGSLGSGGRELRKVAWLNPKSHRIDGLLALPFTPADKIDSRCGLHVHVDIRHVIAEGQRFTQALYMLLLQLEPHVKRLIPPDRRTSSWCLWGSNLNEGERYYAWNAHAMREHGTIEWRMQGGSINRLLIENWALFCQFWTNQARVCVRMGQTMPVQWSQFINTMSEPLRSWCIKRYEKLYPRVNLRSVSNERTLCV